MANWGHSQLITPFSQFVSWVVLNYPICHHTVPVFNNVTWILVIRGLVKEKKPSKMFNSLANISRSCHRSTCMTLALLTKTYATLIHR